MLKVNNWDSWFDLGKIKSIFIKEKDSVTALLDIREIDKRVFEVLLGTGVFYKIGEEYLFMFGGRCKVNPIYLRLEDETNFFNISGEYFCSSGILWPIDNLEYIDIEFMYREKCPK